MATASNARVEGLGGSGGGHAAPPPVQIESQFQVGEYDIVVLSANDSIGLETWLRSNHYALPEGASNAFRPYIEEGMKFFVAKVNIARLAGLSPQHAQSLRSGRVMLSPLRRAPCTRVRLTRLTGLVVDRANGRPLRSVQR